MILIIQGAPAAGKSTLATQLSEIMSLPHISRDNITEWLMNAANCSSDDDFFGFIGHAGYELMYDLAKELSKGSGSFIIEGCFNPEGGGPRMAEALKLSQHEILEIFLSASDEILLDRYQKRVDSGIRHEAHNDQNKVRALADHLKEVKYRPMNIGSQLLELDTGDHPQSTLEAVTHWLNQVTEKRNSDS